jgi:hypothetical protein
MTYPAHESSVQISRVHHAAICKEIGERLWTSLDREPGRLSPLLLGLMERLRDNCSRKFGDSRRMKDFTHASFPPDAIAIMTTAMDSTLSKLPHPVTSTHVKSIAENIALPRKGKEIRWPSQESRFWSF